MNCRYCDRPVDAAMCAHCGAPAPEGAQVAAPPVVDPGAPAADPGPRSVAGSLVRMARSRLAPDGHAVAPGGHAVVPEKHPVWQWRMAAAVLVAALLLLGVLMIRSCSLPGPPGGGFGDPAMVAGPAHTLPGGLATASCAPRDPMSGVERCVVPAGDPLLADDITGGRDLPLRVQRVRPEDLTQTVRQWRSAGGRVISDETAFVSISAASAVLYADPGSGLRIDTGAFVDDAAAQDFLSRSGLLDG